MMDSSNPSNLSPIDRMHAIDRFLSHVWMVRAFLKHSDEAAEDEELASVHRGLYDFMLALGPSLESNDPVRYLKIAKKKLGRLKKAAELFHEIQPEVSGHTNFVMASRSLQAAVMAIVHLLQTDGSIDDSVESQEMDQEEDQESLKD